MRQGLLLVTSIVALSPGACTITPAPTSAPEAARTEPGALAPIEVTNSATEELPLHYEFAFVTLGKSWKTGFTEAIDKGGPALLAEVWMKHEWPERLVPTIERAFGSEAKRWERIGEDRAVALDARQLADLGITAPMTPLWLIGPEGPCRAELGAPILGWYAWGPEIVELSWQVELHDPRPGCELKDRSQWSQIAVLAESLPLDLRFVPAQVRAAQQVELTTWSSPYAELVREAVEATVADGELRADEVWVREVVVPGTEVLELTVASVQREPPDPCMDWQQNTVILGLWREQALAPLELATTDWMLDNSELQGAFMRGEALAWTVHESFAQPLIYAPTREPSTIDMVIAVFHEEDFGELPFSQTEYCGP